MGMGSWDANSVRSYASYSTVAKQATNAREVFKAREVKDTLNPHGVTLRESCDSEVNPNSTAIIIGLDVTGSMGSIAHSIASEGLGILMGQILERRPVSDPHIMFAGIGDVHAYDKAPLQFSQFEPDIRIVEQLNDLYVEGGGGGNSYESYDLPWYMAATRTSIDCFNKRGKKGYLFTIGDEFPPRQGLSLADVEKIFGRNQIDQRFFEEQQVSHRFPMEQLLDVVSERYQVFHLVIEQGGFANHHRDDVAQAWRELLGKRALPVRDYKHVCQVILSAMQVAEGEDVNKVVESWDDNFVQETVKRSLGV